MIPVFCFYIHKKKELEKAPFCVIQQAADYNSFCNREALAGSIFFQFSCNIQLINNNVFLPLYQKKHMENPYVFTSLITGFCCIIRFC